ncbi:MAG TPA: DUF1587 domain-containing protein, partial [Blastocatellia bacterium]|nr:DUF1587 domain-containing protein [Blastocatellia bacterium]
MKTEMRALKLSILLLISSTCLAVTVSVSRAQRTEREGAFDRTIQPFLSKHCYTCHNPEAKSGGLDLESYRTAAAALQNRQVWERIAQRLQAGEMPPPGMPRPERTELEAVLRWIEQEFESAGRPADPKPGIVTARRLNRTEYNNTVRELVGLDLEPATDFPPDDSAHGFDNIAGALSLSPTLMEKYLAAAERIARMAIFGPELKPSTERFEPPQPRRMEINPVRIEQPPFYTFTDYDPTGIGQPGAFHQTYRFPAAGEYLFRIRVNGARPPGSEPQSLQLWIDGQVAETFEVQRRLTATNESLPVFMEVRLPVTAGPHRLIAAFPRLFEGLPPSFGGLHPSTRPIPPPPDPEQFFTPLPPDATPEQIEARKAAIERFRNRKPQFNGMAVIEFEIVGPYRYVSGPSLESRRKIYVCGH